MLIAKQSWIAAGLVAEDAGVICGFVFLLPKIAFVHVRKCIECVW